MVLEEASDVLEEEKEDCERVRRQPEEDLVCVESGPPTHSSTMLLVDEGEAQHLEKKRKLELTLLEKQIEAEERRIKAEESRIEAFRAMKQYYSK